VVNASGLGARNIIGVEDELVFPIRGQTVLVRAPEMKCSLIGPGLYVNTIGESTYVIPRINGDVVVGGTFQEGNWDVSPDPVTARRMLERALKYCPELATRPNSSGSPSPSDVTILRHNVGLRPARKGGARVEREVVNLPLEGASWKGMVPFPNGLLAGESVESVDHPAPEKKLSMRVVHAYGLGPAGYQESWGVAEDVVKLVGEFLTEL